MGRVFCGLYLQCFSGCKNVCISFLMVLLTVVSCFEAHYHGYLLNDYPEVLQSGRSQHQVMSGREIRLKCGMHSCKGHTFRWEFISCGRDYLTKCPDKKTEASEWIILANNIRTKNCSSILTIFANSSSNSGIYRCLLIDEDAYSATIIQVHQVNVIERIKLDEGHSPKLVEFGPTNITVYEDMKIVVKCKVFSIHPVEIRWFKESPEGSIKVNDTTYTILNVTNNHILISQDMYQSKMTIEKASENDSGVYKCVAINSKGTAHKEAYVNVIDPLMRESGSSSSFFLLFFIPVGLALIPITVWLCYYRRRIFRSKNKRNLSNQAYIERDDVKYYSVF